MKEQNGRRNQGHTAGRPVQKQMRPRSNRRGRSVSPQRAMEFHTRASARARAARTPRNHERLARRNGRRQCAEEDELELWRPQLCHHERRGCVPRALWFFERLPLRAVLCLLSRLLQSHKCHFLALFFVSSGIPLKYNGVENPAALQICALSSELLKKCGKFVKSHDEVCPASACRTLSHLLLLDLLNPCN